MTYLDNNIVNVAIPTIQRSLHLSVSGLEWVVSSYLLTVAGLLLVGGRLADVYGRRRLFLAGMAVFTLSSLAAGLAGSGSVLIATRAIQGIGAALLMPATLAIIMATFHDVRERTMAIGVWAAVGALALATGPVLGGLALFTVSSLAAGLASSGGMLIASRAIQGIGAALLMPATLALIVATFTDIKYLFSRAQQQRIHYLPTIFMKKKIGKKIGKKQ